MAAFLKRCPKCRRQKWSTEFPKDKNNKDGLCFRCKDCENKRSENYHQRSLDKERAVYLRIHYDITIEDYELMLEAQNGVCKICGQPETRKQNNRIQFLCVDHDHKTNEIRGILCDRCNKILGLVKDNSGILEAAARYLRENQ